VNLEGAPRFICPQQRRPQSQRTGQIYAKRGIMQIDIDILNGNVRNGRASQWKTWILAVLWTVTSMALWGAKKTVYEETAPDGNVWSYTLTANGAELSRHCIDRMVTGAVTIPNTLGGVPVVGIGGNAFGGCHNMTAITIPDSVSSIGIMAFTDCESLRCVKIPKNVTTVGRGAFQYCRNLASFEVAEGNTAVRVVNGLLCDSLVVEVIACPGAISSVSIPSGVTKLMWGSFAGCERLQQIELPSSVREIGSGAFSQCVSLESFHVAVGNLDFCVVNGLLCNNGGTELVACPGAVRSMEIPRSVTTIRDEAFSGCRSLRVAVIPSNVRSIGENAFNQCDSLVTLKIYEGLVSIGYCAISSCPLLSEVVFPKTLSKMGEDVFYNTSANVYYCSKTEPICDGEGIYTGANSIVSYGSWSAVDGTWQDWPYVRWTPPSGGTGVWYPSTGTRGAERMKHNRLSARQLWLGVRRWGRSAAARTSRRARRRRSRRRRSRVMCLQGGWMQTAMSCRKSRPSLRLQERKIRHLSQSSCLWRMTG